jgi:hypothetical protein
MGVIQFIKTTNYKQNRAPCLLNLWCTCINDTSLLCGDQKCYVTAVCGRTNNRKTRFHRHVNEGCWVRINLKLVSRCTLLPDHKVVVINLYIFWRYCFSDCTCLERIILMFPMKSDARVRVRVRAYLHSIDPSKGQTKGCRTCHFIQYTWTSELSTQVQKLILHVNVHKLKNLQHKYEK